MRTDTRKLSLAVAAGMILLVLFSSRYGMLETGHVCSGQRCGICAQLALSQAALENPAFPGLIILSVFALLLLERVFHQTLRAWVCRCGALIGWKVRLNN